MAIKTYGSIVYENDGNIWKIISAEPHVCIRLKNVFPKIDKLQVVPFDFKNTPENCNDLIWFMERYPLAISETNKKKMRNGQKAYFDLQNQIEQILSPDYKPKTIVLKEPWEPRHYQSVIPAFHAIQKRFLLGDDIGLGKTLSGTLTFNENTLPGLIVAQTHLQHHWKEKLESYTNLKATIIKTKKAYTLPKSDAYIITYSKLAGWVDFFQTGFFKSVIFDEVQELRIPGSDKYRAASTLMYNLEYAMGMSATPIYNYGDEIFSVLNLLNPGCLGSREDFLREWCSPYGSHYKVIDPPALGTYLREKNLFLRRTRKEVGREMPPVNHIIHEVDYDEGQVKKATEIARQLAIKATTGIFTERGQNMRELDAYVRHETGLSKAYSVAEFVKILLANGEKVLLAGWHRDVYDIWLEELKEYKPVMYTGSESGNQKLRSKEDFIFGDSQVMLISLRSGIGLDGLQDVCKCVVFGELDWSPKVHEQVIGRVDRDGQQENVTAFFCTTDFGTDPVMIDILGLKASQAFGITDPLTAPEQQYSDTTHLKRLAESFLKKEQQTLFSE